MAKWEIDLPLRQPGNDKLADWHVDLVKRDPNKVPRASCMIIQFSSNNLNKSEAEEIVKNILFGLNAVKVPSHEKA